MHSGATRNVYIGNIEDFDTFSDDKLKRDFGEYGDIELVNFLKEKNCAFVNFTNISNAIKAIEGAFPGGTVVNDRQNLFLMFQFSEPGGVQHGFRAIRYRLPAEGS